MQLLKAGGGVLYYLEDHTPLILLIKRNGIWDLPKGKLEENESIEECAAREVAEEVGIPLPDPEKFLCETYHEYELNGLPVGKKTYWYSMKAGQTEGLTPQEEEGITELKWVHSGEALNMVGYDNLIKVIEAFLDTQTERK